MTTVATAAAPGVPAELASFFETYARRFNDALEGHFDAEATASQYASEFIAASPAGVAAGRNGKRLRQTLAQGHEYYRAIGTRQMRIRSVRVSPIDDLHCVAHVAWTASYAREGQPDVDIDFDVHYLMQTLAGVPKIFGWITGDEQAVLKAHGIV